MPQADPSLVPERRPATAATGGEAPTNERLLELLEAIKAGVDALQEGQRQLLAHEAPK
jgi:hypothetical protein